MSLKSGRVPMHRLIDALNSLDADVRAAAVAALKVHDPTNRYFTDRQGRVDAVPAE